MAVFTLKCSKCGKEEERPVEWSKITCFDCKQAKHREVAKSKYKKR